MLRISEENADQILRQLEEHDESVKTIVLLEMACHEALTFLTPRKAKIRSRMSMYKGIPVLTRKFVRKRLKHALHQAFLHRLGRTERRREPGEEG